MFELIQQIIDEIVDAFFAPAKPQKSGIAHAIAYQNKLEQYLAAR